MNRDTFRFHGAPMDNRIFPSPSGSCDIDSMDESSRKRKATATDEWGTISGSAYNFCLPQKSKLWHSPDSCCGIDIQGKSCNETSKSTQPTNIWHRFEKDQSSGQSDYAATWQTGRGNCREGEVDETRKSSFVMPHSLSNKEFLPPTTNSGGEFLAVANRKQQEHYTFSQTAAHKTLCSLQPCISHAEDVVVGPGPGDIMSFADNSPFKERSPKSENLRFLELLPVGFLNPGRFTAEIDGMAGSQEDSNSTISSDIKLGGHNFMNSGVIDIPTVGRASLGTSTSAEKIENDMFLCNELLSRNASLELSVDHKFQDHEKCHGDFQKENSNVSKVTEKLEIPNSQQILTTGASPEDACSPAVIEHSHRDYHSHNSLKSDEKCKLLSGKVSPASVEKLWDGSFQLSSSVTVAAVAFYKSGEKMPDVKWSEFVEVKGKVRLEAFEKYIKDLPRSRNRGLMVISLCWKEGSPETGLAGMKMVAKGYKNGERVGVAQLSPGVDIYVCPRSDAIITILAKYGFFKGMAAVQDNPDSLIGCVVWRKNQASSTSVEKKSNRSNRSLSELPFHSPSNSSLQGNVEQNSREIYEDRIKSQKPLTQPAQKPSSSSSTTDCVTPGNAGTNVTESNSIESGKIQLEMCNSSSNEVEAPLKNQPVFSPDEDDLPEFDFNTASGISRAPLSKSLMAVILNKRDEAEAFRTMDGLLPRPHLQSIPISNQRKVEEDSVLPRSTPGVNHGMPLAKKVCQTGNESHKPFFLEIEENLVARDRGTVISATVTSFPQRRHFFDDDDMPEWCPPVIELQNQSLAELTRQSTAAIRSVVSNSTFENSVQGYNCPTSITVRPVQGRPLDGYVQRDPNASRGFNISPAVMPPVHHLDANLPTSDASWRVWKPF